MFAVNDSLASTVHPPSLCRSTILDCRSANGSGNGDAGAARTVYLDPANPLQAGTVTCGGSGDVRSGGRMVVFYGHGCYLWNTTNEYQCWWNALLQVSEQNDASSVPTSHLPVTMTFSAVAHRILTQPAPFSVSNYYQPKVFEGPGCVFDDTLTCACVHLVRKTASCAISPHAQKFRSPRGGRRPELCAQPS